MLGQRHCLGIITQSIGRPTMALLDLSKHTLFNGSLGCHINAAVPTSLLQEGKLVRSNPLGAQDMRDGRQYDIPYVRLIQLRSQISAPLRKRPRLP